MLDESQSNPFIEEPQIKSLN